MTASEKLIAFIRNTFDTALYFAVMAVKENFRNYIRRAGPTGDPSRGMVILGNGPSLSDDLPRLIARREYEAKDFMAVNFFAEDDRFEVVRPGYYVLSDPMFFRDSECRDRVAALYRTLSLKRVFFSAYTPVNDDKTRPAVHLFDSFVLFALRHSKTSQHIVSGKELHNSHAPKPVFAVKPKTDQNLAQICPFIQANVSK